MTDKIFAHLRNALVHGSIFTCPSRSASDTPAQIAEIVFLSERKSDEDKEQELETQYSVLIVPPEDFRVFLCKWVDFLQSLDLASATKGVPI